MNQKQKLVNLIKADLQDFLTNSQREWEGEYLLLRNDDDCGDRERILVDTNNREIWEATKENAHLNESERKEKWEKRREQLKKRGVDTTNYFFHLGEPFIYADELTEEDYNAIVSLIKQAETEDQVRKWQEIGKIKEKSNNTPGLCYYFGRAINRADAANIRVERNGKICGYASFVYWENRQKNSILVAEDHPVLDAIFDGKTSKKGYYLVNTEMLPESARESKGGGFDKYVESKDKITITPYHENSEAIDKLNNKDGNLLVLVKKYFLINNIKAIKLENIYSFDLFVIV